MRLVGTALEFGVVLYADVKITVGKLDGLHQLTVRGESRERQTRVLQYLSVVVVEFIAVAVTVLSRNTQG